jgi:glycosyltransferase involved in cell wall biosynthesis
MRRCHREGQGKWGQSFQSCRCSPVNICFIMEQAYPAFTGRPGVRGGSETQMARISRELLNRGHEVSLIAHTPDGRDGVYDRLLVHGLPPNWAHFGRLTVSCSVLRAMRTARPDVFITQNLGRQLPLLAAVSRSMRRPLVFCTASRYDVDGTVLRTFSRLDALLWVAALRRTPMVVTQTREHQLELRRRYGVDSTVIRNGIDTGVWPSQPPNGTYVLWVGNIRPVKRFDRLGEIALLCPEIPFTVVGALAAGSEAEVATLPPNVTWLGPRAEGEVVGLFRDAALLLNTSDVEGLPNTFLEAWATGRPVFTVGVDFDGFLKGGHYGSVFHTAAEVAERVKAFFSVDKADRLAFAEATTQLVRDEFTIGGIVDRWEELLASACPNRET